MDEIYDFDAAIRRYRRVIAGLRHGALALSFLDHITSLGLSKASISKYADHLITVLRAMDFDPAVATRKDVERVVAWINSQPYKEWTKRDKRVVLKKLVQYAKYGSCDRDTPYPPEVSWIKKRENNKDCRATADALITPEDFEALVKATENRRDKAMLYVLFEGALRPSELLSMNVGSVRFKEVEDGTREKCSYCVVSVTGKTGLKVIPLVVSYRPLLEWLEEHPGRSDLNAPLWCSLATNYKGKRLSYGHFRLIIKRLAKKARLRKDVWPYLFRHSTLTALAKVFTEARLEQFAGWVHGSKMSARYVHFSARDLEDAMLELHGKKPPSKATSMLSLEKCPRCGTENQQGTVHCKFCGYVLDKKLAAEIEAKEKEKERVIEALQVQTQSMQKEIAELRSVLSSLLSSQHPAFQQTSQGIQLSSVNPPEPSLERRSLQTSKSPENMGASALKKR